MFSGFAWFCKHGCVFVFEVLRQWSSNAVITDYAKKMSYYIQFPTTTKVAGARVMLRQVDHFFFFQIIAQVKACSSLTRRING